MGTAGIGPMHVYHHCRHRAQTSRESPSKPRSEPNGAGPFWPLGGLSRRTSLPGRGAHFYSRPTPPQHVVKPLGGSGPPPSMW